MTIIKRVRIALDSWLCSLSRNNSTHKQKALIVRNLILAHHLKRLMQEGRIKGSKQASEWLRLSLSEIDHTLELLFSLLRFRRIS